MSITQCDWQVTKALAVMKPFSEAERRGKRYRMGGGGLFHTVFFIYTSFFSHQMALKETREGSHFRLFKFLTKWFWAAFHFFYLQKKILDKRSDMIVMKGIE